MQVIRDKAVSTGAVVMTMPKQRVVPAWWRVVKRATDAILGSVLLLIALPVIAAAAIAVVLVDRGSPFYAQERIGQGGRRFRMFKLRTMVHGAHAMRDDILHLNEVEGPVFKIKND